MGKQASGFFSPIVDCHFSDKEDDGGMVVSRQQIVFAVVYDIMLQYLGKRNEYLTNSELNQKNISYYSNIKGEIFFTCCENAKLKKSIKI